MKSILHMLSILTLSGHVVFAGHDEGGVVVNTLQSYAAIELETTISSEATYKMQFCVSSIGAIEGLRALYALGEGNDSAIVDTMFPTAVQDYLSRYGRRDLMISRVESALQSSVPIAARPIDLSPGLIDTLTNIWTDICLNRTWYFSAARDLRDVDAGTPLFYHVDTPTQTLSYDAVRLEWLKNQATVPFVYDGTTGDSIGLSYWLSSRTESLYQLLRAAGLEDEGHGLMSFYATNLPRACFFERALVGSPDSAEDVYYEINFPVNYQAEEQRVDFPPAGDVDLTCREGGPESWKDLKKYIYSLTGRIYK